MQQISLFLKLCGVWLVSWAIACFINIFKCLLSNASNENYVALCAIETAVFSFVIIIPIFPVLYLPVLFGLRRLLGGTKPKAVFPLVSAFLCFIPLGWIYLKKSRTATQWIEALFDFRGEFHFVLIVTGFIFGLWFVSILTKHDAEKGNEQGVEPFRLFS